MSICTDHNKVNCGCQTALTTAPPCPTPEDCPEAQPCSYVIDSQCTVYTGDPLLCGGTLIVDTNDNVETALTNIVDYVCEAGTSNLSATTKIYRAYITQTGTNAPVATVMQSTLSGTLVWTRNAAGQYFGTLAGEFTGGAPKVFMMAMNQNNSKSVGMSVISANVVELFTSDGTDSNVAANVEIIIYP